ncbi:P2-like prophage tail protein X [Cohaesibacter sp. ES.047]|uniref:tail protein X n=1 Tax=Cohaesibacter sp. ES.047 TaxID=1798205 RepID=UPI000BB926B1|nr:tail protein X [Cohaesibacter sp. ES.047]SNY94047.1 P2-like prophage tail protein X [Cohaesibacter sp. ES.047]
MAETITIEGDNITLDLLLVRRFGFAGQGAVSKTLALNPGLSALGPVLPLGTKVTFPDAPVVPDRQAKVVTLFGEV